MTKRYEFTAGVWLYPGKAAWHFVTLPTELADEIDFYFHLSKRGWGSLPVTVTVGKTTWQTSIFPDKKAASYLLPLKAEVRQKERVKAGEDIRLTLQVSSE